MASSLARVLKTDMSSGVPLKAMAQALRRKGRHGDTVLAHITPREAAKLKREGGSGTINPDTGLPEFFEDGVDLGATAAPAIDYGAMVPPTPSYTVDTGSAYGAMPQTVGDTNFGNLATQDSGVSAYTSTAPAFSLTPQIDAALNVQPPQFDASAYAPTSLAAAPYAGGQAMVEGQTNLQALPDTAQIGPAGAGTTTVGQPGQAGFLQQAWDKFTSDPLKALIAGGGIGLTGLNYIRAQNQAKEQAKAYQQAYAQAAAQEKALAQPFIQQGGTQLAQALSGQLSAAQLQQMQAAQAAQAQNIAGRGGVGAQQAERSIEDLRQRLLDDQQKLALQLFGAGTPLLQSAINAQLQGTVGAQGIQAQASQAAGQAASGLLTALAALYGYSGQSKAS